MKKQNNLENDNNTTAVNDDFMKVKLRGKLNIVDEMVSKRLKSRRLVLGLSQGDVGRAIGVSVQQVQKYEKAKNRISAGNLFDIAKLLKVPLTYFYEQDDSVDCDEHVDSNDVSEKEIVNIIRAFSKIKNSECRKKLFQLAKAMEQLNGVIDMRELA